MSESEVNAAERALRTELATLRALVDAQVIRLSAIVLESGLLAVDATEHQKMAGIAMGNAIRALEAIAHPESKRIQAVGQLGPRGATVLRLASGAEVETPSHDGPCDAECFTPPGDETTRVR